MQEELHDLLEKLLSGELNEQDKEQLIKLLDDQSQSDSFAAMLDQQLASQAFSLSGELPATERRFIDSVFRKAGISGNPSSIETETATRQLPPVHRVHFIRRWGWAAASILILLAVGTYYFTANKTSDQPVVKQTIPNKIPPGKEGAILTLEDGSQIVLDGKANGVIANQNGSQAILNNGQLSYDAQGEATGDVVYNTMATPRGRQFQVTLPDGTNVWLNAASSIRYPTVFSGKERLVQITGEVYFEVVRNEKMPFRVNINNKETIEVLGTSFNVSAYDNDETINTTLITGSLRVATTIIKPGQQAQVSNTANTLPPSSRVSVINNADIDKILAWKKGIFNFEGAFLQEVMKQLERWYDIEVVYEKGIPDIQFGGKISKDMELNGLLVALQKTEVKFRIEGKKLIVTK